MNLLQIKNLKVNVDGREILHGIDLDIKKGEIVALMGPNGSGKSTLALSLLGHKRYEVKGSIKFKGKEIGDKPTYERAKHIFLIHQNPREVEGVKLKVVLRKAKNAETIKEVVELNKRIKEVAKHIGLENLINRDLNVGLSGGEKKKSELLQMLILNRELVVADEIDSGVDIDGIKNASIQLKEYVNNGGTLLIISHYGNFLKMINPDKVVVMKQGRIIKQGGKELIEEIENKGY